MQLQNKTYKISISRSSNIYSVYDKTAVELNGVERITLDSSRTSPSFKTELKTGDIYHLKIINSLNPAVFYTYPQQENKIEITDTVRDYDIHHPLVFVHKRISFKLKITGLEIGETIRIRNDYGSSFGTHFNTTFTMHGIQGDPLNICQVTGPRACKITSPGFILPDKTNLDYDIAGDCSKQSVKIQAPQEKFDLVTRNSDNTLFNTYVESGEPVIGRDGEDEGRYVAFVMYGKNIDGSSGNYKQVLWSDRKLGITKPVSKNSAGVEGKSNSSAPSISSGATDIVKLELVFATPNVYVYTVTGGRITLLTKDFETGAINRISKPLNGNEPDGDSPINQGDRIGISYDGTWITYNTTSTNIGVPKGNIVVQNTISGKTFSITSLTIGSTGRPMITRYGQFIVAGSSEKFDTRFFSSGIFAIYTDINKE